MTWTKRLFAFSAVAVTMLSIAACGPKNKNKPVFPVTGKVLYERKPAHRALVIFHPVADSDPNAVRPRGEVAADGSFRLSTYGTGDGAPAGDYQVTVEWWLAGADDSPPTNRLPQRYSVVTSSGLTAHVDQAPTELKTIELTR